LWEEYQLGIDERKPAKDWSGTERGNRMHDIKQKYYRRKMIWLTVKKLMERGNTRDAAINKIRQAYGWRCSVTHIINFIIVGHVDPNLVDLSPYLPTGRRRAREEV
jgi:hypothetical protein